MIAAVLRRLIAPVDPVLAVVLALLLASDYLLMMSASPERLQAHSINVAVALGLTWIIANVPPQRLLQLALPLYGAGVALLLGVHFVGEISKGAQRWLHLGVVRIQPSEMLKIAAPMMLAWYFQMREANIRALDFLAAAGLLLLPVGLIAVQPDLGTAILVLASGLFVIYFAGLSWRLIVPVLLIVVVAIIAVVASEAHICADGVEWPGLREYQKHRVCTLLDPASDPLGKGFHTIQSTIAVGSGGVFGKGWMRGTQTHLDFLPERHTDFILAVLSEEFGLLGVSLLLVLYSVLIVRGLAIAVSAATLFSRLLAGALTLSFFTYVFVNMGMVSGILPVVGVPLPFMSYGGTALVTLCIGVGMLMSIARNRRNNG